MKQVLITQRVDIIQSYGERRDALDQNWARFLSAAGFLPRPVMNDADHVAAVIKTEEPKGIVLSGGNDLSKLGGDAPERDATEHALISHAIDHGIPLIGVCRGLQVLQDFFGVPLRAVEGHAGVEHSIETAGQSEIVNSFHNWGATSSVDCLRVCATAEDGVVEWVEHIDHPICGIMWHPERYAEPQARDLAIFRKALGVA